MYRHLEGGRGLNEKRSHARHTRTHRASGVAGGVMHSVRYWIDDAVSINSALDEALKSRSDDFVSRAREVLSVLSDATPDSAELQNLLTSVFAMVPHEWKLTTEAEAKRYFLLFMKLAGADIMPESESAQGRADAVLQTARTICIFEFKFAKSARVALHQISTKGYAKPYVADSRRLFLVGVNYNPKLAAIELVVEAINEVINTGGEAINEVIFEAIKRTPGINKPKIIALVGKSRATVERAIAGLIADGRAEHRGSKKTGGYYVKNLNKKDSQ